MDCATATPPLGDWVCVHSLEICVHGYRLVLSSLSPQRENGIVAFLNIILHRKGFSVWLPGTGGKYQDVGGNAEKNAVV